MKKNLFVLTLLILSAGCTTVLTPQNVRDEIVPRITLSSWKAAYLQANRLDPNNPRFDIEAELAYSLLLCLRADAAGSIARFEEMMAGAEYARINATIDVLGRPVRSLVLPLAEAYETAGRNRNRVEASKQYFSAYKPNVTNESWYNGQTAIQGQGQEQGQRQEQTAEGGAGGQGGQGGAGGGGGSGGNVIITDPPQCNDPSSPSC